MSSSEEKLKEYKIPLEEIKRATHNFQKKIGEGGFGMVYEGEGRFIKLCEGQHDKVAIKRRDQDGHQGNKEFRNELKIVSSFNHPNIIRFIGYCDDANEMIIVYEYAIKGSLDLHLRDLDKRRGLKWKDRIEICLGVAEGLEHLHSSLGENEGVIHRDVKSGNILLDDNLKAKIGDFGLSKFGPETKLVTSVVGTRYYVDPVYIESEVVLKENDIYSFGVVLFEMSSGMMAYTSYDDAKGRIMIGRVRRHYEKGNLVGGVDTLIDTYIKDDIDRSSFDIFNRIAHECINFDVKKRPTIKRIIETLQKSLNIQIDSGKAGKKMLGILNLDKGLRPFEDHFEDRMIRFSEQKRLIDLYEEGLQEFAKGYLKFGINREEGCVVYREWAQAAEEAQLVVTFNGRDTPYDMQKNEFGVWTIKINDVNAIPHNSKVKFRFKDDKGKWHEQLPSWIKHVTVTPKSTTHAARYHGVHWDPPPSDFNRDEFKNHEAPTKPEVPHIYTARIGMRSSEPRVKSYREFADNILPRVRDNNYNTIQLMGVMEHSYYGSVGYHVTNFFAVSSSAGTPEDLMYLIRKAHKFGLRVLMDIVHSHVSKTEGLAGFDVNQDTRDSYFHNGERGYHTLWDSKLFNYSNWEVLRFLLSNLRWWLQEFRFDGFHFRGITSMLYHHHGIDTEFTGDYREYFGKSTDIDAIVYMMLANDMIHSIWPDKTVKAEDVSGMPGLCRPLEEGGIGFDFS